jgi:predicted ribosome-associated RNA-binding protein Tma20
MLDRRRLDCAKFEQSGKYVSINEIAKQNNVDVETFKDQLVKMILDGTIIFVGTDDSNYPVLKMK